MYLNVLEPHPAVVPLNDLQSAYDSGYLACDSGQTRRDCPFPPRSVRADLWCTGWGDSHLNLPVIAIHP